MRALDLARISDFCDFARIAVSIGLSLSMRPSARSDNTRRAASRAQRLPTGILRYRGFRVGALMINVAEIRG